jgi:hypothetical protein
MTAGRPGAVPSGPVSTVYFLTSGQRDSDSGWNA